MSDCDRAGVLEIRWFFSTLQGFFCEFIQEAGLLQAHVSLVSNLLFGLPDSPWLPGRSSSLMFVASSQMRNGPTAQQSGHSESLLVWGRVIAP